MGLFDFIKTAGAKLFGDKKKEAETKRKLEEEAKEAHEHAVRERIAEDYIASLGLEVEGLDITIEDMAGPEGMVDTARIAGVAKNQSTREKIVLAVGNVEGIERVSDEMTVNEEEAAAQFYTVKSGDSLSKISKQVYGDYMKYTQIFEANKPMLEHPDKIYPGQVLRIPPLD